jgi:hypothetical protein
MALPLPTGVTANFPFPTLTPFASDQQPPTHASLLNLQRELNSNAMSVHSNAGGGLHGHLTLTMMPAQYLAIAGVNNGFPAPLAPPANPVIPAGATAAATAEAVRQHQESVRIFQRYHDTDKALVRAIIAATPATYIEALADAELGYAPLSALELIVHLRATYGTMTSADRDANLTRMTTPWSPPSPIEALFKQLEDGQRLAALANEPIANTQLARMGQTLILKTGLFSDGCREWRLRPEPLQTWPEFKVHFARQERDRLETATTASAGYSGGVFAIQPVPHPSIPPVSQPPTHLPEAPTANAVTPLPSGPELAALLAELARFRAAAKPSPTATTRGYCWTHGSTANTAHSSATCKNKADGHIDTATWRNKAGGNPNAYVPPSRRPKADSP